MSTTYIGPYGEDPAIAFVSEGVVNHAGQFVTMRTAIVNVQDLELMVMHFTEEDKAHGALSADQAAHLADTLRGYADALFDQGHEPEGEGEAP